MINEKKQLREYSQMQKKNTQCDILNIEAWLGSLNGSSLSLLPWISKNMQFIGSVENCFFWNFLLFLFFYIILPHSLCGNGVLIQTESTQMRAFFNKRTEIDADLILNKVFFFVRFPFSSFYEKRTHSCFLNCKFHIIN